MKIGLFLPYPLKSKPTTNNFTLNTEESIDGAWNTVGQIDNIKGNFCWTGEWFLLILQEQKMTKDTNRKKSVSLYLTKMSFPYSLILFLFPFGVAGPAGHQDTLLHAGGNNGEFAVLTTIFMLSGLSWQLAKSYFFFFAIYAYSQITCYKDLMKG